MLVKRRCAALPAGGVVGGWTVGERIGASRDALAYAAGRAGATAVLHEYCPARLAVRVRGVLVPDAVDVEDDYVAGLGRFRAAARELGRATADAPPGLARIGAPVDANNTSYLAVVDPPGRSLATLVAEGATFDEQRLLRIMMPVLDGLEWLHRAGVVHGEIDARAIIVGTDGRGTLIGLKPYDRGEPTAGDAYAAIEQHAAVHAVGAWTDVYALGAVMRLLMTGRAPPPAFGRGYSRHDRPLFEDCAPGFSCGFIEAVEAATTIAPQARPQSVTALRALLTIDRDDEALPAPSPPPPRRSLLGDVRGQASFALVAAGAAATAMVLLWGTPGGRGESDARAAPVLSDVAVTLPRATLPAPSGAVARLAPVTLPALEPAPALPAPVMTAAAASLTVDAARVRLLRAVDEARGAATALIALGDGLPPESTDAAARARLDYIVGSARADTETIETLAAIAASDDQIELDSAVTRTLNLRADLDESLARARALRAAVR